MTERNVNRGGRQLERYEAIVEAIDDAVFVVDEDREIEYANGSALAVRDTTLEELRGTAITTLTREMVVDDAHRFERALDDAFETETESPETLTLEVETADGRRFAEYNLSPMYRDGDVTTVVVVARDVTERKRRKQRFRRLTEEYETTFHNAGDAIFLVDVTNEESGLEFRVERFNPAYEATTGLTTDEARGKTPRELLGDDVGARVEANYSRCVESREPISYEEQLPMPEGAVTAQTKLAPVTVDGEVTQIVGISRDISEHVQHERELEQRQRQLTQLHAATRDLLSTETPREAAMVASEAAAEILDLGMNGIHFYDEDADALIPVAVSDESREFFDEIPAIDDGLAWEAFQHNEERLYNDVREADSLYNPDTPARSELIFPLDDRGVFMITSRESGVFSETDVELARMLAANTEVALERVTGEQRLRARQRELERQNDRLEQLTSIVSHDLRNPLNVAQGRLELAREQLEGDNEHLDTVAQSHDRIEALVEDVLTLARGDDVGDAETVDLGALVRDCWTTVDTADATLVVETDCTVRGDRSRLRQLLENLIRNAVEHGGPDVTVAVGDLDDGFYVADDGAGVPESDRDQVFEEGYSTATGGTGFGLSIVQQVVEAHDWDVRVTESDEGGARFEVTGTETGQ